MKYFGTDGFRGRANETLRLEHAVKIGEFLGRYFAKTTKVPKIVIGKDTRISSYMLEYGLAAGIASAGGDAYLMHVTTTPSVSYVTKNNGFNCGVMITASHNPYHDNGIKIINNNGDKMGDEFLQDIERYIDGELELSRAGEPGRCVDYLTGRNSYISYLSTIPGNSFCGYKIGLDCANGASFAIARNVFSILGADVFIMSNQPDGRNINVDCGSTHPEALQRYVVENRLDIGFAFDGDADRCLMVDEKGNLIDGDGIMYIIGTYLKEHGRLNKNTVVATVMSNIGLHRALTNHGIKIVTTDVGDKYVAQEMFSNGYCIGGEQSGHIILSEHACTGDGILTAITLADILVETKNIASALTAGLDIFPQKLKNIKVDDKNRIMGDEKVKEYIEKTNEQFDGNGRLLLRASGTEPLIRIMVEAQDEAACDECIAKTEKMLSELM
ncbi:MAG TPA: phosphoglucosamine mutase [Lachnospiraceae bacterium]|nr:phosphoglucosamine mutase [Lachnospiraceae bacterium]HAL32433.1 phosphoglucosamine mutase [Lachnospiraceae bacterium]HCS00235.1 phosphoglucosamine mutase [Lachnospiraceae bacterium]